MKRLVVSVFLLACLLIPCQTVSAHVLITDDTKTRGAVLHIIPDDDPVAGEEAAFYFDTQDELLNSNSSADLSIFNVSGDEQDVPTKIDGTLITASYVFPAQGVYDLEFTVISNDKTYVFKQSQRISRGIANSPLEKPTYAWAEILVIASSIGFALLVIMVVNRREDIAKHSTF